MIEMLAEQPIWLAIFAGCGAVVGFFFYTQTQNRWALGAMALFAALIPVIFAIASAWETPREELKSTIERTADAFQANDFEAAFAVIDDQKLRLAARSELRGMRFRIARVTAYRSVEVNDSGSIPTATADINVLVEVVGGGAGSGNGIRFPRRIELQFERIQDRWIVVDYSHRPIIGKPDGFSNVRPGR